MLALVISSKVAIKDASPAWSCKKGDVYNAVVVRTTKGVDVTMWFVGEKTDRKCFSQTPSVTRDQFGR